MLFTNKNCTEPAGDSKPAQLKMIGVLATGYNIVRLKPPESGESWSATSPRTVRIRWRSWIFAFLYSMPTMCMRDTRSVQKGGLGQQFGFFLIWWRPKTELAGKTIGFVGFGHVAQKRRILPGSFRHAGNCQPRTMKGQEDREGFQWVGLRRALCRIGLYLSINRPLTSQTEGLVNRDFF